MKAILTDARPPRVTIKPQYGTMHRALRRELLATYPLCQAQYDQCEGWSVEAHHLRPDAKSISDYMAVCGYCHRRLEKEK